MKIDYNYIVHKQKTPLMWLLDIYLIKEFISTAASSCFVRTKW